MLVVKHLALHIEHDVQKLESHSGEKQVRFGKG